MRQAPYDRKRRDIAYALEKGWEYVGRTGSKHFKFRHPAGGPQLIMSSTLGGGRGDRNAIAWIKKNTPQGETA